MACRDTLNFSMFAKIIPPVPPAPVVPPESAAPAVEPVKEKAKKDNPTVALGPIATPFFGVDTTTGADTVLQHNLTMFEWVVRNKTHPNFWGRKINGKTPLTLAELEFIHGIVGCKVAAIYQIENPKKAQTEQEGEADGQKAVRLARDLGFYEGNAIFAAVGKDTNVTDTYMRGYIQSLLASGFTPGMYANTDAHFDFCHMFSRGFRENTELFRQCLIWAASPNLPAYTDTTDAHLVHPDYWGPHSPSCLRQDDIAIWQYGARCNPVNDYLGAPASFHINLIKDVDIIVDKML